MSREGSLRKALLALAAFMLAIAILFYLLTELSAGVDHVAIKLEVK